MLDKLGEGLKEKGVDAVTDAAGSVMGGGDSEEVAEEE